MHRIVAYDSAYSTQRVQVSRAGLSHARRVQMLPASSWRMAAWFLWLVDDALTDQSGEFLERHAEQFTEDILVVLAKQGGMPGDVGRGG